MSSESNLARNLEIEVPFQPQTAPTPKKEKVHTPLTKRIGITKGEKLLVSTILIVLFALIAVSISLEITIASTSRTLQDTVTSITESTTVNENLEQEVQELSRYDRVYEIANKFDLDMNEKNVRNVIK
ncbi:cell division protein FtsL [Carnobacterium alterfunditum]|uniref:Cell division protein FtsL n=1 Tax=Carnobacterium alterfunditum TaxID=28230 RepID=A0A1N6GH58_9LACT|nr:cell division protein FtsL [Carnobacterium alterfunditum]SIO06791.1 cell division protein FtsL [Carnobacterium alterfunditum]